MSCAVCATGELLYGAVCPPTVLEQGRQYPTVLYVYGGPQIQVCREGGRSAVSGVDDAGLPMLLYLRLCACMNGGM